MEGIVVVDFGSQFTMLIARRLRELGVYCEIHPWTSIPDKTAKGYILSGSPRSVKESSAPHPDLSRLRGKIPILGICYGAQLLAWESGALIEGGGSREYGRAELCLIAENEDIFEGIDRVGQVWMSHGDSINSLPNGATILASTPMLKVAAFRFRDEPTYGFQFHPEVYHSVQGGKMLANFAFNICKCKSDWTSEAFIESSLAELRRQIGDGEVVMGVSGGVDSTVAAVLLRRAIGDRLHPIFIDNGLLRKGEAEAVLQAYRREGLKVHLVDASEKFLSALEGVRDPERKRKIIGSLFVEVFERCTRRFPGVKFLAQGTIYPDVIESAGSGSGSHKIKSHHNVGGLPEKMNLQLVEPLRLLFKDEVRKVGKALGIASELLDRHPFPGPSLAIRVLGEVTREKLSILREADAIFLDELKAYPVPNSVPSAADPTESARNLYEAIWQAGAILLPVKTVGVMGDERTYAYALALRAVTSTDGMTADWVRLPYDFLSNVSNAIINRVDGINRIVYDISSKPPATIEWE